MQSYLPAKTAGHVLITSRYKLWRTLAKTLPIETWSRETSVEFLTRRVKRDDAAGAAALAAELDDLPLALEQAAAYIEATRQSFDGYRALYRIHFAELAGANRFRPRDYPNPVLTTWILSLAAAERDSSAAGDLLRLFAFLAPEDIPRDLLTEHAVELPPSLAAVAANPP